MTAEQKEALIKGFITAYNNFSIEGMLEGLDSSIIFENVSDGRVDLQLKGLPAFKKQAEKAKDLFSSRAQVIRKIEHLPEYTEVEIEYNAVLAASLPNGLKKGGELHLNGRSIFKFSDKKIIQITDIS